MINENNKEEIRILIQNEVYRQVSNEIKDFRDNTLNKTVNDLKQEINTKIDDINQTKTDFKKINQRLESSWKIGAAVLGTLIILSIAELSFNRVKILQTFLKTFYPPSSIYSEAAKTADIDDLTQVINEVKTTRLKEWMTEWKEEDYKKVFGKPEFFNVMDNQAKNFYLSRVGTLRSEISPNTVEEIGGIVPIPVLIVPIGRINKTEEITKNCQKQVLNNEEAAIIIIPENAPPSTYLWLGCDEKYPKNTYLGISLGEGVRNLKEGILLKEVDRGRTKNANMVEVRITQKLAEDLGITGSIKAYIYVTKAE